MIPPGSVISFEMKHWLIVDSGITKFRPTAGLPSHEDIELELWCEETATGEPVSDFWMAIDGNLIHR